MIVRTLYSLLFAFVLAFGAGGSARAHPHEFVEMKINVLFDKAGKAIAMRYFWRFDEFFSAYALESVPVDEQGKQIPAGLQVLLQEILGNIEKIAYFTKFDEAGGVVPQFGKAFGKGVAVNKRQLEIVFEVPFKEPVDLSKKGMTYAVYDPEFYIAINHSEKKDAVVLSDAPKGCQFQLNVPEPADDIVDFASSLGRSESAGNDLGINFAEWVKVSCP